MELPIVARRAEARPFSYMTIEPRQDKTRGPETPYGGPGGLFQLTKPPRRIAHCDEPTPFHAPGAVLWYCPPHEVTFDLLSREFPE
jgi:hypothetical protein